MTEQEYKHISVDADSDERVIYAGSEEFSYSDNAAADDGALEEEDYSEASNEEESQLDGVPKNSRIKEDQTLEDLRSAGKMTITQKVIIIVAVVFLLGFVVYYNFL